MYELTQPAKWYFWKLYRCACFCWGGAQSTLSRQVHWRSGDKSPVTKWRETSTGVCFFQSKDLWKLIPESLKQKMFPAFSSQVRGDRSRPWLCSWGGLCCPPRCHLWCGSPLRCHGAALGVSAMSVTHLYGGGHVSKWPPAQQPEVWEAMFSKHLQGCAFLRLGVLGSERELIKCQMSF